MRVYAREHACAFRFTREAWGELGNFHPLAAPIAAGPFRFATSAPDGEALDPHLSRPSGRRADTAHVGR